MVNMDMLVSSLNDIKSTELVICRFACCYGEGDGNELVILCDPSDRTPNKITCSECGKVQEIDMKPVFSFGTLKRTGLLDDYSIVKEVGKIVKISVV